MNKEFMPKVKSVRTRHRLARIKKYFTEKPEGNIWKRATVYLIFLRYIGPLALVFSIPLLAGLLSPNGDMDFSEISDKLASSFAEIMEKLYNIGSSIATENPIVSKIMVFGLSYIIWVFYIGFIYLFIDIMRHVISWIFNSKLFAKGRVDAQ